MRAMLGYRQSIVEIESSASVFSFDSRATSEYAPGPPLVLRAYRHEDLSEVF